MIMNSIAFDIGGQVCLCVAAHSMETRNNSSTPQNGVWQVFSVFGLISDIFFHHSIFFWMRFFSSHFSQTFAMETSLWVGHSIISQDGLLSNNVAEFEFIGDGRQSFTASFFLCISIYVSTHCVRNISFVNGMNWNDHDLGDEKIREQYRLAKRNDFDIATHSSFTLYGWQTSCVVST